MDLEEPYVQIIIHLQMDNLKKERSMDIECLLIKKAFIFNLNAKMEIGLEIFEIKTTIIQYFNYFNFCDK